MTRIVQCLSHSIESYDQLKLYTELGYEAVDIGGYIDPRSPHDPKRPALPDAPFVPEVKAAVDALGTDDNLGAAQAHIPEAVLDWLGDDGVLIYHHYLERLIGQWPRIRGWMDGASGRRVIWRTVGQSVEHNERLMAPLRKDGLEIVRYSPKERNIPGYAGEDALIRFYKDPDEYKGWRGDGELVINITQHLYQREPYTNWGFWDQATKGLPRKALGPGSEEIGGSGELSYDAMMEALRYARAYLYTGTQPASYTLGLIEAMMTGIPVVSIGPAWMRIFPYGPDLFEGAELVGWTRENGVNDPNDPAETRSQLELWLADIEEARDASEYMRQIAIAEFGKARIGHEWKAYLGAP
jgi:hypothetical protein